MTAKSDTRVLLTGSAVLIVLMLLVICLLCRCLNFDESPQKPSERPSDVGTGGEEGLLTEKEEAKPTEYPPEVQENIDFVLDGYNQLEVGTTYGEAVNILGPPAKPLEMAGMLADRGEYGWEWRSRLPATSRFAVGYSLRCSFSLYDDRLVRKHLDIEVLSVEEGAFRVLEEFSY